MTLVLDFTRYPVCLVWVRNRARTNSITCETKKIEEKRPVLSIGKTRRSKEHVAGLVIGKTLIRKGHLPGRSPNNYYRRIYGKLPFLSQHLPNNMYGKMPFWTRGPPNNGYGRTPWRMPFWTHGPPNNRYGTPWKMPFWRNPDKKRAAACMSNLKAARAKLKWYRQYYPKHGKGICTSRRSRYALAEPKGSVIEVQEKKIQHQLLANAGAKLELVETFRKQSKTAAKQLPKSMVKTVCLIAAKRLCN